MRFALFLFAAFSAYAADEWIPIFNGQTLDGWKAGQNGSSWTVKDGAIRGEGNSSPLYYMDEECGNCEFKADVHVDSGSSVTLYVRARFGQGTPQGYWVPIAQSESVHVLIDGNHLQVTVNDKVTVDTIDEQNAHTDGFLAFQGDRPGSVFEIKNPMIKVLSGPSTFLEGTWRSSNGNEFRILEERDGIRYQSTTAVNYYARADGYDYRVVGSADYDHISIQEVDKHLVHFAMKTAKLRKKLDPHTYLIETSKGREPVGRYQYTVSPDGNTLTIEDLQKHADTQTFTKVE